ncbi:MAG: hypothetical protein ACRD3S_03835 [Terracidiphilus sp.]
MDREEAVVLVSRALACVQAISALLDLTYLPDKLMWLRHYMQLSSSGSSYGTEMMPIEQIEIALYFGRIAMLLFFTFVFWNCGPRIARFLLPEQKSAPQDAQPEPAANEIQ